MKQGDAVKLIIAIVILIAAGILIAWQFELFGGTKPPPPPAADAPPARNQPRTVPGPGAPKSPSSSSLTPVALPLA